VSRARDLLNWELSNYVANSAVTHLPQVKSSCRNISELGSLRLLNRNLHSTPQSIASNVDGKNLFDRRVDYPAEQRVSDMVARESVEKLFTQCPSDKSIKRWCCDGWQRRESVDAFWSGNGR